MAKPIKHVRVPSHWTEFHRETPFLHETAFMHPTRLHFNDASSKTQVEWHSRRHRKGRNFIIKHAETKQRLEDKELPVWRRYKLWAFEFKNISWWVAQFFLWGSMAWVINGFAVWLPTGFPETNTGGNLARVSAIVGGSLFIIGAILAYLEALNIHPMADGFRPKYYLKPDIESGQSNFSSSSPTQSSPSQQANLSSGVNSPRSFDSPDPILKENRQSQRLQAQKRLSLNLEADKRKSLNLEASERRRLEQQTDGETQKNNDNKDNNDNDNNAESSNKTDEQLAAEKLANRRSMGAEGRERRKSRPLSIQIPNLGDSQEDAAGQLTPDNIRVAQTLSVVSDSYNPSSYVSRSNSVTSMTSASESYDSEFPDRVPTPTPPPSPPPKVEVVNRFYEEDLKRKYTVRGCKFRELGFLASFIQLIAATVFYISCITGMHNVLDEESVGQRQGLYWTPQVVGGMGFVLASILYMYEVQPKWYKLKPGNIGWQVGFWNLIGAIGFTLSGIFGYYAFDDKYQRWGCAFSTYWGGWAFLLGSYIQLLEAINK